MITIKNFLLTLMDLETIIENVLYQLFTSTTNIKALNVYQVIVMVMEIAEKIEESKLQLSSKRQIVYSVINRLTDGPDGVRGTKDDLISQSTRDSIAMLIENKLVNNFIDVVARATNGLFNINKKNGWCCFK